MSPRLLRPAPSLPLLLAVLAVPLTARAAEDDGKRGGNDGQEIVVTARRLDTARDSIQASIGANDYKLTRTALDTQPGGADKPINLVLLQAPGVTQDSDGDGEIHIRNEHANIQYRLNGVTVPDSFSGFGPLVDARVAESIELLTGALPAQYGYRTAGVVQLKTRARAFEAEGDFGVYGGAHGTVQPSFTWRDSKGDVSYFLSGSYLRNNLGYANPTPETSALHDRTEQWRGFGFVSWVIDGANRLSAFGGTSIGSFEIPNQAGVPPAFALAGLPPAQSAGLDQRQNQQTHYGVVSWQFSGKTLDFQLSPFVRWARARFTPDAAGGEIQFNGTDSALTQVNLAFGAQGDASWRVADAHTVRFGFYLSRERDRSDSVNRALAIDPLTGDPGTVALVIPIAQRAAATTIGLYLQDEWQLAPALTLNAGLRYDHVAWAGSESQLSPRFGLVWKPTRKTTIHAGYARYFTPPPVTQIGIGALTAFANTTAAAAITLADPVRAEREHLFDIGAQQVIARHLTLGIDTYYKIKRNLLDDTQYGTTELLAPFNYADGYGWGVELSASYEHGPLELYANVARGEQRAKNITSNQFFFDPGELAYIAGNYIYTDHSQAWTASGGASLKLKDSHGEWQPAVEFIYGSGLRKTLDTPGAIPNGATQQPYLVVNLGLARVLRWNADHALTIRIDLANLFDKVYLVHDGSGVGAGQPQYGARRGIFFGIRESF
ncbi:MAG: TonB-dependent receptor [Proteobacteria bacterium]|nr:TonB-dependent receptor [Pseudomonadota bacterium]